MLLTVVVKTGVFQELELERNRDEMKTTWSLSEGFELLKT